MKKVVWTGCAAAAILPFASGNAIVRGAGAPTTLTVAGRASANVSMTAQGAFVAVVWSASAPGGATDIYSAVSRDSGTTFSSPVRVNSTAGDARASGEQPPRLALVARATGAPSITVIWMSKSQVGTTLLTARSDDGGVTFSRSALVPGGEAAGNRGWANVTADARGGVRVVWLDHRELAQPGAPMAGMTHPAGNDAPAPAKKDGVAMAQMSKLYIATIGDPTSARSITGGVCYCCKTSIVAGSDNTIYAAWRHVYPGSLRDIAFTLSRDGGRTFAAPIRVSEDNWVLDGCPEDGPAMALDLQNRIHITWPTKVTDTKTGTPTIGIFYATSRNGAPFSERVSVPTEGLAHHPQIVIGGDGAAVLAWDERENGTRRVVSGRVSVGADGSVQVRREVLAGPGLVAYPVLAASRGHLLAAWTEGAPDASVIRITMIPAPVGPANTR